MLMTMCFDSIDELPIVLGSWKDGELFWGSIYLEDDLNEILLEDHDDQD